MKELNQFSDSELVLEYQAGNKKALTVLVERWHYKFCKQAYWYSKRRAEAKDIAQESWKVIMVKLMDLKDPNKFGYWALSIVCRKAIDASRKKSKTFEKQQIYHQSLNVKTHKNEAKYDAKKIVFAIKKLPNNQQIVLRLFYTENYSLVEISELLNVSKGTVKSRLFYAREKLKSILKSINYEE